MFPCLTPEISYVFNYLNWKLSMLVLMKLHERKNCGYQGLGVERWLRVFTCTMCVCVYSFICRYKLHVCLCLCRGQRIKIGSMKLSFSTLSFGLGFLNECLLPAGQTEWPTSSVDMPISTLLHKDYRRLTFHTCF